MEELENGRIEVFSLSSFQLSGFLQEIFDILWHKTVSNEDFKLEYWVLRSKLLLLQEESQYS